MKPTRAHIIAIIAIGVLIITVNAVWRVRYFGAVEKQYWESKDASPFDGEPPPAPASSGAADAADAAPP